MDFESAFRKAGFTPSSEEKTPPIEDHSDEEKLKKPKKSEKKKEIQKDADVVEVEKTPLDIDDIILQFDIDGDLDRLGEQIEKIDRSNMSWDEYLNIPMRSERMWNFIGKAVKIPGLGFIEINAAKLKSVPPPEWLETATDLRLLGDIITSSSQSEVKHAIKNKIKELLSSLDVEENEAYYNFPYVFLSDGTTYRPTERAHYPPNNTSVYDKFEQNKDGWIELKNEGSELYFVWHKPSEYVDIPTLPEREGVTDLEKDPNFQNIEVGGVWADIDFHQGSKGLEYIYDSPYTSSRGLKYSHHAKFVPQRDWMPKADVPYMVRLARRIDKPSDSYSPFRGVWVAEPINAQKDEDMYDLWVKDQESVGRYVIEYKYHQSLEGDAMYYIRIRAKNKFIRIKPSNLNSVIDSDEYFVKRDKIKGAVNKFSHLGTGILDKEVLEKIEELAEPKSNG